MSYRRIIHSLILLLAVWSPLNNAIAGAAVLGCPMMMAHTLEQGLARDTQHPAETHAVRTHCDGSATTGTDCVQSDSGVLAQASQLGCDTGCHCSYCLLLGAAALPTGIHATASFPLATTFFPLDRTMPAGEPNTPFRPPIATLV